MAAPAWGTKTEVLSGVSASRVLKSPASTSTLNLIVAAIKINGPAVVVAATGFSVRQIHVGGAEEHTLAVLYAVATESGELPCEISWGGAERFNSALMFRVTGLDASAPVEASATKANEIASKSLTFPSVVTGHDAALSILIGGEGIEESASSTPPAGYTSRQALSSGAPFVATAELAKAGATGEKVATLGTSRTSSAIHLAIAAEPVPVEEVFELPPRLKLSTGAIYHVATTGDDEAGDGSGANPFKTVAAALAAAPAGSIVEVAPGTYPEEELLELGGTAESPTTVRSGQGGVAKFEWSGAGYEGFRVSGCSYLRFERLEFGENHGENNVNVYCRLGSHHLEFYRCVCHDGQRSNFYTNGEAHHIHFYNCVSYRSGRRQEETHNLDHGFYLDGVPEGPVGHVCVNCVAYDNDASGFSPHEHTSNSYFVNCTAVHNGRSGFNLGGDMTESYVVNCIAAFNGFQGEGYGFRDSGTAHGNFIRNVISFENVLQFRDANPGYVLGAHKEEDPQFVDWEGHDFRLKPNSPALAYGDSGWAPKFDLHLNRRTDVPAIGATEAPGSVLINAGGAFVEGTRHLRTGGSWVVA